jgi:hypothetical protein
MLANKPRGYRNEPLPGNVHDELWNFMVGHLHLKKELTEDPIYATGARCLGQADSGSKSGRQAAGRKGAAKLRRVRGPEHRGQHRQAVEPAATTLGEGQRISEIGWNMP